MIFKIENEDQNMVLGETIQPKLYIPINLLEVVYNVAANNYDEYSWYGTVLPFQYDLSKSFDENCDNIDIKKSNGVVLARLYFGEQIVSPASCKHTTKGSSDVQEEQGEYSHLARVNIHTHPNGLSTSPSAADQNALKEFTDLAFSSGYNEFFFRIIVNGNNKIRVTFVSKNNSVNYKPTEIIPLYNPRQIPNYSLLPSMYVDHLDFDYLNPTDVLNRVRLDSKKPEPVFNFSNRVDHNNKTVNQQTKTYSDTRTSWKSDYGNWEDDEYAEYYPKIDSYNKPKTNTNRTTLLEYGGTTSFASGDLVLFGEDIYRVIQPFYKQNSVDSLEQVKKFLTTYSVFHDSLFNEKRLVKSIYMDSLADLYSYSIYNFVNTTSFEATVDNDESLFNVPVGEFFVMEFAKLNKSYLGFINYTFDVQNNKLFKSPELVVEWD